MREVSFECNPEDIDEEYIEWILNLWINRISLGVQSLNETTLMTIHRSSLQSIFDALESIEKTQDQYSSFWAKRRIQEIEDKNSLAQSGGQTSLSVNVDFILWLPYSLPGETLKDIQLLHKKYPFITHTSVYMLEEWLYPKDWKEHSTNEIEMEREYGAICDYFESIWWNHYEISNWAKPGFECAHNQWYWNHTNSRWFGLSATSFVDSVRWENSASFSWYYAWKQAYKETLTEDQINLEKIIHGLRTFTLSRKWFDEVKLKQLETDGLILPHENAILLTQAWIFRENFILSELLFEESS